MNIRSINMINIYLKTNQNNNKKEILTKIK